MKKSFILLIFSLFFVFTVNAQKNYVGSYEFGEDGGQTAGGTAVYVGHDLQIKSDGTVTLTANGFQTARDYICKTKVVGSKLQIIFQKYNPERENTSEPYKGGEILLTLEWKTIKGKKVLWTTFGKYRPSVNEAKKGGGIYFKKS